MTRNPDVVNTGEPGLTQTWAGATDMLAWKAAAMQKGGKQTHTSPCARTWSTPVTSSLGYQVSRSGAMGPEGSHAATPQPQAGGRKPGRRRQCSSASGK